MGHTNSTANLALPQFIGSDKPTWLGDINGAFSAIDEYAGTNDAAVAAAASDASSAISQASAAVNTANAANTTAGNASAAANNAIGVANNANAIAGTVDAKVGLLADLNTSNRTSIVKAINEVIGLAAEVDSTDYSEALTGSSTGYAIPAETNYQKNRYKTYMDRFTFLNLTITCSTPSNTAQQLVTGLPIPTDDFDNTFVVQAISTDAASHVVCTLQNGNLYVTGGAANGVYKLSTVYPCKPSI